MIQRDLPEADCSCASPQIAIALLTEVLLDLGASIDEVDEPGLSPRQRLLESRIRAVRKYLHTIS